MTLFEYIVRQKVRFARFKLLSLMEPWEIKDLFLNEETRAFLVGTCVNGNLGDQAISYCSIRFIREQLHLPLYEVNINQYWHQRRDLKKKIRSNDILFIQGGGNIGDEYMGAEFIRRDLLSTFHNNLIISFPQTVSFSKTIYGDYEKNLSQKIYAKHKKHIIFAREEYSYNELKKLFPNSKIVLAPDIVLMYSDYAVFRNRGICKSALLCLRSDCEGIINAEEKKSIYRLLKSQFEHVKFTDTFVEDVNIENRKRMIEDKLNEFASAELIVTDRLHGMVLSALSGTPCVVLPNYNNKVKGVYEWISSIGSIEFIENIEELSEAIDKVIAHNTEKYKSDTLQNNFDIMKRICMEQVQ